MRALTLVAIALALVAITLALYSQREDSDDSLSAEVIAQLESIKNEIVESAITEIAAILAAEPKLTAVPQSVLTLSPPQLGSTLPAVIPTALPLGAPIDPGECSKGMPLVMVDLWSVGESRDILFDLEGNLLLTGRQIERYDTDGNRLEPFVHPASGQEGFRNSGSAAMDSRGNLYLAAGATIGKFDSDGELITTWGARFPRDLEYPPGTFDQITGITIDEDGFIYVLDGGQPARVQKFTSDGEFVLEWGRRGVDSGMFNRPQDIVADQHGNIYVADSENWRVQQFSTDGEYLGKWGQYGVGPGGFFDIESLGVDGDGCIYAVQRDGNPEYGYGSQKFSPDGTHLRFFGTEEGDARIKSGIAIASSKDGTLYVLENERVKVYRPTP